MSRVVYQLLLRLHPAMFRNRFGEEMLWVFDEIRAQRSAMSLFADCASSLCRQWFVGYGLWKAAIAIVLALLPILSLFHGMARHKQRWLRGADRYIESDSYRPTAQTTVDGGLTRSADRH